MSLWHFNTEATSGYWTSVWSIPTYFHHKSIQLNQDYLFNITSQHAVYPGSHLLWTPICLHSFRNITNGTMTAGLFFPGLLWWSRLSSMSCGFEWACLWVSGRQGETLWMRHQQSQASTRLFSFSSSLCLRDKPACVLVSVTCSRCLREMADDTAVQTGLTLRHGFCVLWPF